MESSNSCLPGNSDEATAGIYEVWDFSEVQDGWGYLDQNGKKIKFITERR